MGVRREGRGRGGAGTIPGRGTALLALALALALAVLGVACMRGGFQDWHSLAGDGSDAGATDASLADTAVDAAPVGDAALGTDVRLPPEGDNYADLDSPVEVTLPYSHPGTDLDPELDKDCFRFSVAETGLLTATTGSATADDCVDNPANLAVYRGGATSGSRYFFCASQGDATTACRELQLNLLPGSYILCLSSPTNSPSYGVTLAISFEPRTLSGICEGSYSIYSAEALAGVTACSELTGSLWIYYSTVSSIAELTGLTRVGGDLTLQQNESLSSLSGLESLQQIGGHLSLGGTALADLDGLSGLTSVGGQVSMVFNTALVDISGLAGLTLIPGMLFVSQNDQLQDLTGLHNVAAIDSGMLLSWNDQLVDASLDALVSIGATDNLGLDVNDNHVLLNLSMPSLRSIGGAMLVVNNFVLPQCQVDQLVADVQAADGISGEILVSGNDESAQCSP